MKKNRRKERDYIKMAEELSVFTDEMIFEEALEIVKREYKLSKQEGETLKEEYFRLCGEKQESIEEKPDEM